MPETGSPGPQFLKEKYGLHTSPEVASAARRTEIREGEPLPQDPKERVQNYLDRFTEILERDDPEKRARGIEAIKRVLHDALVIKPEDVPESAFLLEQRIAREQGHGDVPITDEFRGQKTAQIVSNQTRSLDLWIDYLSSPDSLYPDWAKYWAFRSVTEMGKFQKKEDEHGKEIGRFQRRDHDTVASFPPMNPRALAMTIGVLRQRLDEKGKPKAERSPIANPSAKLSDPEFQALLSSENFSKIYGQFLIEMPEYSVEGLQEIRGKWVTYPQGSDARPLVDSLEGYPLEWCIANYDTARDYLKGGAMHAYYSKNEAGEDLIPRLAIRMSGDRIAEDPRGIAQNQNLDPYIVPVLDEKLKDFGAEGDAYRKKSSDMKRLTAIDAKMRPQKGKAPQELTPDDLRFLYEIDAKIEGFGYERDPRIAELRSERNAETDMPIVFECDPGQIARHASDIGPETKAFVGPLEPGIFDKIADFNIEHIFTSFPERPIRRMQVEVGGKTGPELELQLKSEGFIVSDNAKDMLRNKDFMPVEVHEEIDLIRLSVDDLDIDAYLASTYQVFDRAQRLGLELVPADTAPHLRSQLKEQSFDDVFWMGMKPIANRDGAPFVFELRLGDDGLWLNDRSAKPGKLWGPDNQFFFRFRRKFDQKSVGPSEEVSA